MAQMVLTHQKPIIAVGKLAKTFKESPPNMAGFFMSAI